MTTDPTQAVTLTVAADTQGLQQGLDDAARTGQQFARVLATSFTDVAVRGRGVGDVLSGLAAKLSQLAVQAAFKPLEMGLGQIFQGLLGGADPFAGGTAGIIPFGSAGASAASGSGAALLRAAPIIVNVTTPDAESFQRSETQIAAMVARAASLGQRNL